MGRHCALTDVIEKELSDHAMLLQTKMFGITRKELMALAFEIAEKNGIKHVFNKETQTAGKTWFLGFMKRNPWLSLRQPQSTSQARKEGFQETQVSYFFYQFENVLDTNSIDSTRIFNMDETGISTVHRPPKVLAKKGTRHLGATTSGERGANTTVVCCMSAAGSFVPPLILFKRKRMVQGLSNGAPAGGLVLCNESGWMDKTTFVKWLKHFIDYVKPTTAKPVLLVLDGHTSHTKNLEAINMARQHGVIMVSFPPHCTHGMQPLDVSFFKPLKTYYNIAHEKWLRTHPEQKVTAFDICPLFAEAYREATKMTTAVNGFENNWTLALQPTRL